MSEAFTNIQIDPQSLPSVDNLSFEGLEKPYLRILLLQSLILIGALIIAWFFVPDIVDEENKEFFKWGGLALIGLSCLRLIPVYFGFVNRGYALREKDLAFRKGWLFRSVTLVPFMRVQHAEVTQGPLSRMFGLAKLKVFTAGGSQSDISIPGLTLDRANQLKRFVLNKLEHGTEEE